MTAQDFTPPPVTPYLTVDGAATWTQAIAAGARVVMPLADPFWGDRRKKVASQAELDAGAKKHFT